MRPFLTLFIPERMLNLIRYCGVPTFGGPLPPDSIAALQAQGAEVLTSFDKADLEELSAASPTPAGHIYCIVYLKDYSEDEMAEAGAEGFHAGFTFAAFLKKFATLEASPIVFDAAVLSEVLRENASWLTEFGLLQPDCPLLKTENG